MVSNGEAEGGSWRTSPDLCSFPPPQTQKEQENKWDVLGGGGGVAVYSQGKVTDETGVTAIKNTHPFSVTLTSKRLAALVISPKGSKSHASSTAEPGIYLE